MTLHDVTNEFKSAIKGFKFPTNSLSNESEKPPQGMSMTKKILIGSGVVIGVAGVTIIAAPIVFPGSIIAAKAAAITATAKTAAVATVTKAAVATKAAASAFVALDTADKINKTAEVILYAQLGSLAIGCARPYVYLTSEEELQKLLKERTQRKSLAESIAEYHRNQASRI